MKRQIDEYYLTEFRELLKTATREELINYFDEHIINDKVDDLAGLKRAVYNLMINFRDNQELNKKYYDLYQNLKNKNISYDEAKEAYLSIKNVN